ncbi:auxilin-related protein 2-like isoform X1 [Mangifera indica]|uniref:auxilin-related protein 2-like isoform X1 n=1 Tax=Mangifera indica TaxID=29780 RepID=UPI001CF9DD7C|nr:auxilin-related protein 2-like isoform X1 [Mangifera indica]
MDEFGVLTERFGLKPQGKAAPMAASKRSAVPTTNGQARSFSFSSGLNRKPSLSNSNSFSGEIPDDILFQSKTNNKSFSAFNEDVFGQFQNSATKLSKASLLDFDSMFKASSNSGSKSYAYDDDVFGLNKTKNEAFGTFSSPPKRNDLVDDLLGGGFGGAETRSNNSKQNVGGFDDLMPGFGASSSQNNRTNVGASKSAFMSADDPFVVLEGTSTAAHNSSDSFTHPLEELGKLTQSGGRKPVVSSPKGSPILKPPPKPSQILKTDQGISSIDELEDFAMGRVRNNADASSGVHHAKGSKDQLSAKAKNFKEAEDAAQRTQKESKDDLESFFSMTSQSSSTPRSRATTSDPVFDAKINMRGPYVAQRTSSRSSHNVKKVPPATNMFDGLASMFDAAPLFGEFEEYEGETNERRRARLGRHQRTNDRVAKAVADMNQRDLQTQQEQEERSRIADVLDVEIKHWAAGKEGNMRALLSSLQYVLWPECGWEPVSLTDLITSNSVKKVYRKATLCVHPDKVQQRGATIKQKYTAEKVFDILKEAWSKFNKEELS